MTQQLYHWPRFWHLSDEDTSSIDPNLSLPHIWSDWTSSSRRYKSQFQLSELLDIPCLVLLGEPGMGKSQNLIELRQTLNNDENNRYCFFNLADFTSSSEMVQEVFTDNLDFVDWQIGSFNLHLFLDSLDEAIIQTRQITPWLQKRIDAIRTSSERLRLRITCRNADWPIEFETYLRTVWGADGVKVYHLAPLQEADVFIAAQQNGLDAELFWQEIVEKKVDAFASRPITLNFLIEEFQKSSRLPDTKSELYRKGCLTLCRDINLTHEQAFTTQPEERFIIAARVAALTIFTAKIGISEQNDEEKALWLGDCASYEPDALASRNVDIFERNIRETLSTGLFRGTHTRQWLHKTIAEFLAAWYVSNKLELPQIRSLIFHQKGRLIPQLEETAAWIASFKEPIFDEILKVDPQILLRSDIATGQVVAKQKLIVALFEKCLVDTHFHYDRDRLAMLQHVALATMLKPFMHRRDNENVQELAIHIAVECRETELVQDLVVLALDPEQTLSVRERAARGVVEIGDEIAKSKLKPLALLPLDNDYSGLKWSGLRAVWPQNLTAGELFSALIIPSVRTSRMDYYFYEDWQELVLSVLDPIDLPFALQWIAQQEIHHHEFPFAFAELIDSILFMAWQYLDQFENIAQAFAATTIALWQRHETVINHLGRRIHRQEQTKKLTQEIIQAKNSKRRLLLEKLIPIASHYQSGAIKFLYDVPLLSYSDVPWLIDYFRQCNSHSQKILIGELIRRLADFYEPQHFDYVYQAGKENPGLWDLLNVPLFIDLDSEAARELRERHRQKIEDEQWHQEHKRQTEAHLLNSLPVEHVRQNLRMFEEGDIDAWRRMSDWMVYQPNGGYDPYHLRACEFLDLPVWQELRDEEKERIVDSGACYIQQHEPDHGACDRWWEKRRHIFWPIVAGCRAFFALLTYEKFELIEKKDWQKWAPALTFFIYDSLLSQEGDRERKQAMYKLLRLLAPEEVSETIVWIAEYENQEKHFMLASRLKYLLDDDLAHVLLQEIREEEFSVSTTAELLASLAEYKFSLVDPLLREWLVRVAPIESLIWQKTVISAWLLLQYTPDTTWAAIWSIIEQDVEFGHQLVRRLVRAERINWDLANRLTEVELGGFCLWLFKQYPPKDDPPRSGTYRVTPEHELASLRDGLLSRLAECGTEQGLRQLKRIQTETTLDLGYTINRAELIYRRNSWQVPAPKELSVLFHGKASRWIQNESQLLDVLEETLIQLNRELQGEKSVTPSVIDLWNEYPHGSHRNEKPKFTPKDEERLSDYIERYLTRQLKDRNVFVGRETQIRRGNYTDILVTAHSLLNGSKSVESLSVVIEVKGCWHSELKEALGEQLVGKYLKPHGKQHGLYLVGRFFCDKWSQDDDRNRWSASSKVIDVELEAELQSQAQDWAKQGYDIRIHFLDGRLVA